MRSAHIPEIMQLNNLELVLPSTFALLTTEYSKIHFIQKWEQTFDQIATPFDEWFTDRGYKEPLHKARFATSHNELTRYKVPTWPTSAIPTEQEPKQQDIAKYVNLRMTRETDRSTSPTRMENALKYLQIHAQTNPGLTPLFHKWTADAKDQEFEHFVKSSTLPRHLPNTKEAWSRYRSHSFTSSQEDSLSRHMANINLSSSTPVEKKNIQTFHSQHPETYEKCIGAAAILQPASSYDFLMTALHVQANY